MEWRPVSAQADFHGVIFAIVASWLTRPCSRHDRMHAQSAETSLRTSAASLPPTHPSLPLSSRRGVLRSLFPYSLSFATLSLQRARETTLDDGGDGIKRILSSFSLSLSLSGVLKPRAVSFWQRWPKISLDDWQFFFFFSRGELLWLI